MMLKASCFYLITRIVAKLSFYFWMSKKVAECKVSMEFEFSSINLKVIFHEKWVHSKLKSISWKKYTEITTIDYYQSYDCGLQISFHKTKIRTESMIDPQTNIFAPRKPFSKSNTKFIHLCETKLWAMSQAIKFDHQLCMKFKM